MRESSILNVEPEDIQTLYDRYPLQLSEIRILILHPSKDHHAPIQCSFDIVNLDGDSADYEAVSYTWGDPVEGWHLSDQTSRLCGLAQTIKGNLRDALRRFRRPDCDRRLWVDALSINQADHVERARQVVMMAQIYACASQTLVWVGEDTDEQDGAIVMTACAAVNVDTPIFASMSRAQEQLWFDKMYGALSSILQGSAQNAIDDNAFSRLDELKDTVESAAQTFIHRRYFTRRWILQELFNAKSIVVHCGRYSIGWETLKEGIKRVPIKLMRPAPVDPGMDMLQVHRYLEPSSDTYSSPLLDLMWCARCFGGSECSDPRDRIYALLGFSSASNVVKADYTISPEQVWMNLGLALLREGYLGLLLTTAAEQFYQGHKRNSSLPSWLPDFSSPTDLLPRDYPQGPVAVVDQQHCLNTALRCFGEVTYQNDYAICTGMPDNMLEIVSAMPPGPVSRYKHEPRRPWDDSKAWLLLSGANKLMRGDLICEVPNRRLRGFFIVVRPMLPDEDTGDVEKTLCEVVGIATVTNDGGEYFSGDLRPLRIR